MKSSEIRETFLGFFEERGHQRVDSAPVVPKGDPTLLFTNAGMNQFKDVFLGLGRRDYSRAVDTQKCIRVSGKHNDLEEVGPSGQHHTFFEMLGNWSFGDYFKAEAIAWGWELLTRTWGLENERLWGTVFEGNQADGLEPDVDAEHCWRNYTDVPETRVLRLPKEENFWEMGDTGPCGPCSEFHYYLGDDPGAQTAEHGRQGIIGDNPDWIELWNLVFIQYNRRESGQLDLLPAVHVDTGMGFERMCRVLQGVTDNYGSDIFQPIIARVAEVSGREYNGTDSVAMRVIADHVRALTFAIGDGALPANEGAGYVLRRLLRRAARFGRNLGLHEPFLYGLSAGVADVLGDVFPEIVDKSAHISLVIRAEEEGFGKTLDRGLEIFERFTRKGELTGSDAFQLYDTYGFPLDLTELMAREQGLTVDTDGFANELALQRRRGRAANKSRFKAAQVVDNVLATAEHSHFVGYDTLEIEARIVHAETEDQRRVHLVLDRTPFYAEAGGQVGDRGSVVGDEFTVAIEEVRRDRGGIIHAGLLEEGEVALLQGGVRAQVDGRARQAVARNHTATHLLHEALRRNLGDHVDQMGSLVTPDRLRFDFSHFSAMDDQQLKSVLAMVNESIRANLEIEAFSEDLETARQLGARALFGEKYEARVRVVRIADFSLELCGGTHVVRTGEIGLCDLLSEGGVAAGIRRIEALTGEAAELQISRQRDVVDCLREMLNAGAEELPDRVSSLVTLNRQLDRQVADSRRRLAGLEGGDLLGRAQQVDGIRILAARVEAADVSALRTMADGIRENLDSGAAVLGTVLDGGKVSLVAVVSNDLVAAGKLRAGDIVKSIASEVGGSGGGKPHLAQAGGRDPEKLEQALAGVVDTVRGLLR